EIELAGVVRRTADLVHGQRRFTGIRDRAGLVVPDPQRDPAVGRAIATDHRGVAGQVRPRTRRFTRRVRAYAQHDRTGRPSAYRIRRLRHAVHLQVELAGVIRRSADLVHRQPRQPRVGDRARLVVTRG